MKAAVLYKAQTPLVMEDLDIPEPGPSQVMVKICLLYTSPSPRDRG